ncbi:MAG: hypothetical protein PHU21_12385 [Elusimicrobia bacterium]|nr:hypothetical protein [Elusimicrobiota bacterium]
MNRLARVALAVLMAGAAGCAGGRAQSRAQSLCADIRSQGPQRKDYFMARFGPPESCSALPYGEVCEFHAGRREGGSRKTYELVRIEFNGDGVSTKFYCEVRY